MLPVHDEFFMRRALDLAQQGLGLVEPNPLVGAIVLKDGQVVGEGFHNKFGGPHAEVIALQTAGQQARGATLYVTLEPCCHFGKTPPCTDAIIAGGIQRVVCAMVDPFPQVSGRGIKILSDHGIQVDVGLLEVEARSLNRAFLKRINTGKPYVIAKWAQTLDGAVATIHGESRWISSAESRELVHIMRGRVDAIIVGLGTAQHDDPLLNARPSNPEDIKRIATRIVLDSQCHLSPKSQLVRTASQYPLIVACSDKLSAPARKRSAILAAKGVTMLPLRAAGKADARPSVRQLLTHLYRLGHANVLVEGGPHVLGSFIDRQEVDEAHIFLAPKLIPGAQAIRPIFGPPPRKLAAAPHLEIESVTDSGGDVYAIARWKRNGQS